MNYKMSLKFPSRGIWIFLNIKYYEPISSSKQSDLNSVLKDPRSNMKLQLPLKKEMEFVFYSQEIP